MHPTQNAAELREQHLSREAIEAMISLLVEYGWDGDQLVALAYAAMKEAN